MATAADLDADVAAAVEALAFAPVRLASDYLDTAGEVVPRGAYRYRLRVDAREPIILDSNRTRVVCQAQVEILVRAVLPVRERTYTPTLQAAEETLIERAFWEGLASVVELAPDSTAQVAEEIQRTGDVLWFQVAADCVLQQ